VCDARLLAAAEELIREFEGVPVLDVLATINVARRSVTTAAARPDPATVALVARQQLAARTVT
jgi:hypothetical protein